MYEKYVGMFDTVTYYKNGSCIGHKAKGKLHYHKHYIKSVALNSVYLSRAQGFKYWKKYFPNKRYWDLPIALQNAIDEPCHSFGYYISKKHREIICYEG